MICKNTKKCCAVCDEKDCWRSTANSMWYALSSECPKYRCDREIDNGYLECEHCGFIDTYILNVYGKAVYDDYQSRKHSAGIESAETMGMLGRKRQDT